jgi:hypothetical protein
MPRMRRASSRNASTSETSTPSHPSCRVSLFVPGDSFSRPRAFSCSPSLHSCLCCGTISVRHASTDRVCQHSPEPLCSRHLRSFKKRTLCGCPRGPERYPLDWDGLLRVPNARGMRLSGLTPAAMPRGAHSGNTALMNAAYYDHHEIVEQLVDARADLNTKNSSHGCALPRSPSGDLVGRRLCRLRLRRPAGTQRCTLRRGKAPPNPPWRCSSAAPTRPSRTRTGNAVLPRETPMGRTPNRPESAQANASPRSRVLQQARRVRRGGGGGPERPELWPLD